MTVPTLTPISSQEMQGWLQRVTELQHRLAGAGRAEFSAEIANADERLNRTGIIVTFGGWQKSGKSSLVNGALKRSVLSVDDLPETGVICQIRAGEEESAIVRKNGKNVAVPCNPESLRQFTALQPGASRRRGADLVDRVQLTLCGTPIPRNVFWIDPPGADDNADMTVRAKESANLADVLIFVNSSRQPLSDSETAFLADHVERHGPASVVLAVNAFLEADNDRCWTDFNARKVPFYLDRINDRVADMGFTSQATLQLYPVSARALAAGDGAALGGHGFMKMLLAIDSPTHPRVQRTRIYREAERLTRLESKLRKESEQRKGQLERAEAEALPILELARTNYQRLQRDIETHVGTFIASVAQEIRSAGTSLSGSVSAEEAKVTTAATMGYANTWKSKTAASIDKAVKALDEGLETSAAESGLAPMGSWRNRVHDLVMPASISVSGGRNDLPEVGKKAAMIAGGAVAAGSFLVGALTLGIGGLITAGLGAGAAKIAYDKAVESAATEAAAAIRADIDAKTNAACDRIRNARGAVLAAILESFAAPVEPCRDDLGWEEVQNLAALADEARNLASLARQLAGARARS
jgi:hypothetical protein